MSLPQIKGSVMSNQLEVNPSLIGVHIDFSILKVQPPNEYRDLGKSLEIANSPTFNPKGAAQHGLFANEIGADGTSIWAAATSSSSAIAVHLLASISIWMELISARKQTLATSGKPIDFAASGISLTRDQVANWHTSAQAWRLTADQANERRQRQLLLIIDNLGISVSGKSTLSDSVLDVWRSAMITVDKLVAGKPQSVQTGAPLLGLASWHLYPDMVVFGRDKDVKDVKQNDPLINRGGIITLGIQDTRRSGDGIYWSLPLAHLRYYGEPVRSEASLSSQTSRVSIDELLYVALGSLVRRWCADADDIEPAAKLVVQLDKFVDIPGDVRGRGAWLPLLASTAQSFLTAQGDTRSEILQFIKCGRRRYPLFIDHPGTDSIFGLSNCTAFLKKMPGNSARVSLLRHVAKDFSHHRHLMVIQCRVGLQRSLWELASVEKFRSNNKRTRESDSDLSHDEVPRRYLRWLNRLHIDQSLDDIQADSDLIRLDAPIPWLWTPLGYQWQNVSRSFYGKILEEECDDSDWQHAIGATVQSRLAFGDPEVAALYVINVTYWSSFSPNIIPKTVERKQYRSLPNIFVMRHIAWALQEKLPSKDLLSTHLTAGEYSSKEVDEDSKRAVLTSLRALISVWLLYKQLPNATVELKVAARPLAGHQWILQGDHIYQENQFGAFHLTQEQTFACIARFESGNFNFQPSAMKGVLAISSGNSMYVARCLLQDPCQLFSSAPVERVVGNLGKSGMAMLVSPEVPQVRSLADNVRLVNHHPFDGSEENCFHHTTLHLSFTEWQLPIDIGSRGNRDVEAYYIEAAIGVYDRGEWVADVNILDVFKHEFSRIMPECTQRHETHVSKEELCKFVTIDSWEELLDSPPEVGVVRARKNWQARLAAAALSIQRGHETRIVPQKACWTCFVALPKLPRVENGDEDENHIYDDDYFGVPSKLYDEDNSDSEIDDIVTVESSRTHGKRGNKGDNVKLYESSRNNCDLNRNIVYIL
ncbi:hypothetical protein K432DRAFT_467647 [Lepidopterella palustris CBS 459.81]|uniref:Uncharacterized protein n=1 Tax=Lepidopterella palustris CBS 459.81 TaxID=1314670 RepID=A0A8E2E0H8_9PEZI|nr:hypothetical protein K432DRAFT_467647 [Lepidopterella palustris CBS 459.81]